VGRFCLSVVSLLDGIVGGVGSIQVLSHGWEGATCLCIPLEMDDMAIGVSDTWLSWTSDILLDAVFKSGENHKNNQTA
jgi:hypothetical protein